MTSTPNMGLTAPTVLVTTGPTWANEINGDLTLLDAHDHTTGKGVPITPDAISMTKDLTYSGYGPIQMGYARFKTGLSQPSSSGLLASLYVYSGDIWYQNGSGTNVQITNGSNLNVSLSSNNGIFSSSGTYGSSGVEVIWDSTQAAYGFYVNNSTPTRARVQGLGFASIGTGSAPALYGATTTTGSGTVKQPSTGFALTPTSALGGAGQSLQIGTDVTTAGTFTDVIAEFYSSTSTVGEYAFIMNNTLGSAYSSHLSYGLNAGVYNSAATDMYEHSLFYTEWAGAYTPTTGTSGFRLRFAGGPVTSTNWASTGSAIFGAIETYISHNTSSTKGGLRLRTARGQLLSPTYQTLLDLNDYYGTVGIGGAAVSGSNMIYNHLYPSADVTYDLGASSSYKWRTAYVSTVFGKGASGLTLEADQDVVFTPGSSSYSVRPTSDATYDLGNLGIPARWRNGFFSGYVHVDTALSAPSGASDLYRLGKNMIPFAYGMVHVTSTSAGTLEYGYNVSGVSGAISGGLSDFTVSYTVSMTGGTTNYVVLITPGPTFVTQYGIYSVTATTATSFTCQTAYACDFSFIVYGPC